MRRIISLLTALLLIAIPLSPALAEIYSINFSGGSASVNSEGETVIPSGLYDELYVLRNDNGDHTGYAAGILKNGVMLYAVLDTSGKELSDFKYSSIQSAGTGYIVSENGVYRYLTNGSIYDSYEFSALKYISGGRVLAVTGNRYDDIGDTLTILWPEGISFQTGIQTINDFGEYSEGFMPLYDAETQLFGYIGTDGSWKIKPMFRYAGDFKNGFAVIATENGYGVADVQGRIVLSAGSRILLRSDDAFAAVRGDNLRLYDADLAETCVIPLYGAHVSLTGKYAILYQSDHTGVYGLSGELMFSLPADASVTCIGSDRFIIRTGSFSEKSIALYGDDGSMLSEETHVMYALDDISIAYGTYDENGIMLYGLMNYEGACITSPVYYTIAYVADGMYCADTDEGAVLIDSEGTVINTFIVNEQRS